MNPTNENEINNELEELNTKKSVLDVLNLHVIKLVKDQITPGLVIIFNKSISEGVFPEILRTAKVITIYKKNDDLIDGNDRPISLQVCFTRFLRNWPVKE